MNSNGYLVRSRQTKKTVSTILSTHTEQFQPVLKEKPVDFEGFYFLSRLFDHGKYLKWVILSIQQFIVQKTIEWKCWINQMI